jgi:hypothetical protein
MKQRRKVARIRIDRSDIAAFVSVTPCATKREVVGDRLAKVLQCDYVVDLMFRQRETL